jgi:hypothetical protein
MEKYKLNYEPGQVIYTSTEKATFFTYQGEAGVSTGNKRLVLVQCRCKKLLKVQLTNIRNGNSICCGKTPCRTNKLIGKRNKDTSYNALLYSYKKHARERGLSFDLTFDEFKKLLSKNCIYCKVEPFAVYQILNSTTKAVRAGIPVMYNGIDRVNSQKGYTLDNTVSCCKICNRAKSDLPLADFLKWIETVYNNTKNGTPLTTL